jgi:putative glutamine amidotransferase
MNDADVTALYHQAEGVLCVGGGDISPALYNKQKHPKTQVSEPKRDILELGIIRRAIRDKKPFLGICRGMQSLAVATGGTLHQHIPDELDKNIHAFREPMIYEEITKNSFHNITLDKKSHIHRIVGKKSILVNSGHHQSVAVCGQNVQAVAMSKDGIVEIIEHRDPSYFCIGIQSHPEIEESGDLEPIFGAFAQALAVYRSHNE